MASFYLLEPDNETDDDENDENAEREQDTQSDDASSTSARLYRYITNITRRLSST